MIDIEKKIIKIYQYEHSLAPIKSCAINFEIICLIIPSHFINNT